MAVNYNDSAYNNLVSLLNTSKILKNQISASLFLLINFFFFFCLSLIFFSFYNISSDLHFLKNYLQQLGKKMEQLSESTGRCRLEM